MDTLAPTRERIAQAHHGVDEPEVSQAVQRRAYIVRDIWSDLYKRDQITAEERDAGQKFAAHLELAYKGRSITPSYGQRHAEGTPVGQQAQGVQEDAAARAIDYYRLHDDAKRALSASSRMAMLLACEGRALEEIGRLMGQFRDRGRAAACAVAYLKIALELLTSHYGMRRRGVP